MAGGRAPHVHPHVHPHVQECGYPHAREGRRLMCRQSCAAAPCAPPCEGRIHTHEKHWEQRATSSSEGGGAADAAEEEEASPLPLVCWG